jgi:hypothetical protein
MQKSASSWMVVVALLLPWCALMGRGADEHALKPEFHTSDRCLACHNGLTTASGKDISIGFDWRASIMANSSRDPYWQGSVRRESIDHPESKADIEDECSVCHMPITRYEAKLQDRKGEIFSHLPFRGDNTESVHAEDGVSCAVCHQISKERLGTAESFNGGFVVEAPKSSNDRPEYGPFTIRPGQTLIMQSSTGGFRPTQGDHIAESALCGSCHTLKTKALGPHGEEVGTFPEQMPFQEWLHSDYAGKRSCQSCHMPEVQGPAPIAAVLGENRVGVRQHTFVGANFFMQKLLNRYRDDLSVAALPQELTAAAEGTMAFLQSEAARVQIENVNVVGGHIQTTVFVENLTGHKLPTAYPSRRAWLHLTVRDRNGRTVFESGALNPDGSIHGNDNDTDPLRFEAYYRQITSSDQVQIYESIMKDQHGKVTTGLLSAIGYLKDSRLLPHGFDKRSAEPDIVVVGEAADDPNFTGVGDRVEYSVPLGDAQGPFHVEAELWYQSIGFRWAHNLGPYQASEPRRFVSYYDSMASSTAIVLARAEATQ